MWQRDTLSEFSLAEVQLRLLAVSLAVVLRTEKPDPQRYVDSSNFCIFLLQALGLQQATAPAEMLLMALMMAEKGTQDPLDLKMGHLQIGQTPRPGPAHLEEAPCRRKASTERRGRVLRGSVDRSGHAAGPGVGFRVGACPRR